VTWRFRAPFTPGSAVPLSRQRSVAGFLSHRDDPELLHEREQVDGRSFLGDPAIADPEHTRPSELDLFPLAGMPSNSPRCVPRVVKRPATHSPALRISSVSWEGSGNAARKVCIIAA
jgi:hypothetical protein